MHQVIAHAEGQEGWPATPQESSQGQPESSPSHTQPVAGILSPAINPGQPLCSGGGG